MTDMTLVQALQVTGVCMGVVFCALIVIMFLIEMFKYVFPEKKDEKSSDSVQVASVKQERIIDTLDLEEDLIVAMMAAVNLSNDQPHTRVQIVSFREVVG